MTSAHQPCGGKGNPLRQRKGEASAEPAQPLRGVTPSTPADGRQHCYDFLVLYSWVRYRSPLAVLLLPVVDVRLQIRESLALALGEIDRSYREPAVDILRDSAPHEDDDGNPLWPGAASGAKLSAKGKKRHGEGVRFPQQVSKPRPSRAEVENRVAHFQLWIAQRQPRSFIRDQASILWDMTSECTLRKYMRVARSRMVEELVDDRLMHQAEQIYALMDVARRAADAEQFSASVGAHRVICEIAGLLRGPVKAPMLSGP